jgi:hypothetical protein
MKISFSMKWNMDLTKMIVLFVSCYQDCTRTLRTVLVYIPWDSYYRPLITIYKHPYTGILIVHVLTITIREEYADMTKYYTKRMSYIPVIHPWHMHSLIIEQKNLLFLFKKINKTSYKNSLSKITLSSFSFWLISSVGRASDRIYRGLEFEFPCVQLHFLQTWYFSLHCSFLFVFIFYKDIEYFKI